MFPKLSVPSSALGSWLRAFRKGWAVRCRRALHWYQRLKVHAPPRRPQRVSLAVEGLEPRRLMAHFVLASAVPEVEGTQIEFQVAFVGDTDDPSTIPTTTLDYYTSDGTGANKAVQPEDYTDTSGTLTFTSTGTYQIVRVDTNPDGIYENDQTFTMTFAGVGSVTGTIISNDPKPNAGFSTNHVPVTEPGPTTKSSVAVTVTLDRDSEVVPTNVSYTTADLCGCGTSPEVQSIINSIDPATLAALNPPAAAGTDYETTKGTLDFPVQYTSDNKIYTTKSFTVTILNDHAASGPKDFLVVLTSPNENDILNPKKQWAIVTINDNAADGVTLTNDGGGHLTGVAFPGGASQSRTIDATTGNPSSMTNELGQETDFTYNGAGYLYTKKDALNLITTYLYDAHGMVTSVSGPALASVSSPPITQTVYDANGRVAEVINQDTTHRDFTYDAHGNMVTETDERGNTTSFTYDATTNVRLTETNPLGQTTTFGYDAAGQQITVTDPLGHTTTTGYDSQGDVTSVTDPLGHATTSTYTTDGQLATVTDPLGHTTTYTYLSDGRLSTMAQPNPSGSGSPLVTTYSYDDTAHTTAVTDPLGHVTTSTYNARGWLVSETNALGAVTTNSYDAAGELIAVTDPLGLVTSYTYNADGEQVTVSQLVGTVVYSTTTTIYDALGNVTATKDANGNETDYTYDALNRQVGVSQTLGTYTFLTTTLYDAAGNVTETIDADGNQTEYTFDALNRQVNLIAGAASGVQQTSTTLYDAAGNVTETIDARNDATTFAYDAANRQVRMTELVGTVVYSTTTTLYDAAGNVTATFDARNNETQFLYDALNRQTVTIDALGARVTTLYDAVGNVTGVYDQRDNLTQEEYDAAGRQTVTVDALGAHATTVYDAVGNVTETLAANGLETDYTYDGLHRQVRVTELVGTVVYSTATTVYDAAGNVTETIAPNGLETEFTYDALNRQVRTTELVGTVVYSTTTTLYDGVGNVTASVDARSHETQFLYDALNRQTVAIDPLSGRVTTLYDAANNVTATVDANNHETDFTYDALNRQVSTTQAAGTGAQGTTTTLYDAAGNVTGVVDANGNLTQYEYDALNRQTVTIDALGNRTTMVYDAVGNVTSVTNALVYTTQYQYDALNRVTVTIDPLNRRTTTLYDAVGNATSVTDPAGDQTQTEYDALGRATVSIDPLGHRTTSLYDAVGNVTSVTDPQSETTQYTYDALSRVIVTVDPATGRTTTLYDGNGNVTEVIDSQTSFNNVTTFQYDALNRKINEKDPLGNVISYAYDAAGNLTSTTDRNGLERDFTYDAANRQTGQTWYATGGSTVTQRVTFTYDAMGHQTLAANDNGAYTMTYDALGRVRHVDEPSGIGLTYSYDAIGERTEVEDSLGGLENSYYDGAGELVKRVQANSDTIYTASGHVYDGTGSVTDVYDPGLDLAGIMVTLYAAGSSTPSGWTETDSSGNFSITAPAARYELSIDGGGYYLPLNTELNWTASDGSSGTTQTVQGDHSWTIGLLDSTPAGPNGPSSTAVASGHFFDDLNSNGTQDGGEPDLAGVTVTIAGTSTSVTSDASGDFWLIAPSGTYQLDFSTAPDRAFPASSDLTWDDSNGATAHSATQSGSTVWTIGLQPLPPISGHFFDDSNGNATQDGGEADLSGVGVTLYAAGTTTVLTSTTTDSSGDFSLSVPDTSYYLVFTAPSGSSFLVFPTASTLTWDDGFGTSATTGTYAGYSSWTIGLQHLFGGSGGAAVTGHFFDDTNGNGTQGGGEADDADVSVTMYLAGTTTVLDSTSTDSSGDFSLTSPACPYYLVFAAPSGEYLPLGYGWQDDYGTSAATDSRLGAASWTIGLLSASQNTSGGGDQEIEGLLFADSNGNGAQDTGEAGLDGITVTLYEVTTSGKVDEGSTTTATDGSFTLVTPNMPYFLEFGDAPLLYPLNANVQWSSSAGTSAMSPVVQGASSWTVGLQTYADTVTSSGVSVSTDAGIGSLGVTVAPAAVGTLYEDANENGVQDTGETGLSGSLVEVWQPGASSAYSSGYTDAGGHFGLAIPTGPYGLVYQGPDDDSFPLGAGYGWLDSGGHDAQSPSYVGWVTVAAGMVPSLALTDPVYVSYTASGNLSAGGTGVAGLTVTLYPAGSTTAAGWGVTDSSGDFSISTTAARYSLSFDGGGYYFPFDDGLTWTASDGSSAVTQTVQGDHSWTIALLGSASSGPAGPSSTSTVIGHFFDDTNGNGTQDGGEGNLAGVTVTIYGTSTSVTSDASGNFTLTVPSSSYQLVFATTPDRAFPTSSLLTWDNSNGSSADTATQTGSTSWTIGLQSLPPISFHFFDDINGNGTQDGDEPYLGGVTVNVYQAGTTTLLESGISAGVGDDTVAFPDSLPVPDTSYYLVFSAAALSPYRIFPDASTLTWNDASGILVQTGDYAGSSAWSIGLQPATNPFPGDSSGSISGHFFSDSDGDGSQDGGETDLAGVSVTLYQAGTSTVLDSTTTDGSGDFSLSTPSVPYYLLFGNSSGAYYPLDYAWADDAGTSAATGTLTGGSSWTIGLLTSSLNTGGSGSVTVSGTLFVDSNGDGTEDGGETGAAGITVTVYALSSGFTSYSSTTTGSSGTFSLSAPTYPYYVQFGAAGLAYPVNDGLAWADTLGSSASTVVKEGSSSWTIGLQPYTGSVTSDGVAVDTSEDVGSDGVTVTPAAAGTLFDDINQNGVQDTGELGLSGLLVEVFAAGSGTAYASGYTDSSGHFALPAPTGGYTLVYHLPDNRSLPLGAGYYWQDVLGHTAESPTYAGGVNDLAVGMVPTLSTTLPVDFTYDAAGRLGTVSRYSDAGGTVLVAVTSYSYDADGDVTAITTHDGSGGSILSLTYSYDTTGLLTGESQNGVPTATYTYDATNQLTGDGSGTYSYDLNGNRTMSGYTYEANNQLLTDGTWTYTYDAEGNETDKVAGTVDWTYGYNAANELVEAQRSDGTGIDETIEYKYDAWGNRIAESVQLGSASPAVTQYVLDGWNPATPSGVGDENFGVYADLSGSGSLETRYLRGDAIDQLFARSDYPEGLSGPATTFWYLTDNLGSTRELIDNTGTIRDTISYDGFGNVASETNSLITGRYQWTGREFDTATGLQDNRARWYDAATGRWMSQDPLGLRAGDSNLYRYSRNDPIRVVDKSGLDGEWVVENYGKFEFKDKNNILNGTADGKHNHAESWKDPNTGTVWVTAVDTLEPLDHPSGDQMKALRQKYPGWSFSISKKILANDSIQIKSYYTTFYNKRFGFPKTQFVAKYDETLAGNPKNTHWIQFVTFPLDKGRPPNEIDGSSKRRPYYDEAGTATNNAFDDVARGARPFRFKADLFIVDETAAKTVCIWQGVHWGYSTVALPAPIGGLFG